VIKSGLDSSPKVYKTADIRGNLSSIVSRQGAALVIALGKDALDEAMQLPSSVTVVYGLVLAPPQINRPNTTGVYMATPAIEYINISRKFLPSLKRLSLVGSHEMLRVLDGKSYWQVASFQVGNTSQLFKSVNELENSNAIVLLPDGDLLNPSVLERMHLLAYRKNVPLLGISESNVQQGSLFALVFDPVSLGRQIGEQAAELLSGTVVASVPPSPPQRFNLFVNVSTAKKVGVSIPHEMIRIAKKVYE
jgi:ABC-type uncharacterized transport system substrate-binding protein